ncbi:MAG: UbiA family prenyltransferase [Phycisphaerales bacterium]|jgi:4-hydroxybenzoate polyprenyltransferase|nr:UbiA family prenyltransferase [Phycisphaerales bacterium]
MSSTNAWFQLLRLSNTPTILSNALVGLGLAIAANRLQWEDVTIAPYFSPLRTLCYISFAILCAYLGGIVLNDVVDLNYDKQHRADRPIPQGIISKKQATIVGITLLAFAIAFAFKTQLLAGLLMVLLVSFVLAYTFFHRALISSLLCMGVCRGLTYLVAFTAFDVHFQALPLLVFAGGIGWYTAALTYIAREEATNKKKRAWLVLLVLPAFIVPAVLFYSPYHALWMMFAWIGCIALLSTTIVMFLLFEKPVHGIHALLAGFCILDMFYLVIIGEVTIAVLSGLCLLITIAFQQKIPGT